MKRRVKNIVAAGVIGLTTIALVLTGCSFGTGGFGTISLDLTDAPIVDAEGVEGVFITIESIAYNLNDEWVEDTDFSGPQTFNLLELTGGEIAPLSDMEIEAGEVTQIRFMTAAAVEGDDSTMQSYIAIDNDGVADGDDTDDTKHELFVPSADQTGYKANGPFTVPVNGTIEITADFDIRKSVHEKSGGIYILRPTIRLVVNNQAGTIVGDFTDDSTEAFQNYTIFAYEDGTYDSNESSLTIPFENAISSTAPIDSDDDDILDSYKIPFLAEGNYDLVVVGVASDGTYTVLDSSSYNDIEVSAESEVTQHIVL
jgi:hypothetical protein